MRYRSRQRCRSRLPPGERSRCLRATQSLASALPVAGCGRGRRALEMTDHQYLRARAQPRSTCAPMTSTIRATRSAACGRLRAAHTTAPHLPPSTRPTTPRPTVRSPTRRLAPRPPLHARHPPVRTACVAPCRLPIPLPPRARPQPVPGASRRVTLAPMPLYFCCLLRVPPPAAPALASGGCRSLPTTAPRSFVRPSTLRLPRLCCGPPAWLLEWTSAIALLFARWA